MDLFAKNISPLKRLQSLAGRDKKSGINGSRDLDKLFARLIASLIHIFFLFSLMTSGLSLKSLDLFKLSSPVSIGESLSNGVIGKSSHQILKKW